MKKFLVAVMVLVLSLSLCACGGGESEPTYKIGETVSTERVSVTLRDIKPAIAVDNTDMVNAMSGNGTIYFTPVSEFINGNPFAAPMGSTLVWFEFEIENTDRDGIELDPSSVKDVNFAVEYDGNTYEMAEMYPNTRIGANSNDGEAWGMHNTSNVVLMPGGKMYYRMYIEIPNEISETDKFKFVVSLINVDGGHDTFAYVVNEN